MLIEPSSNHLHKRKYAFITDPSDPETPQPTLKKLKLDTLKAIWQDFNLPPTKNFRFNSLITKFGQVFQSAKILHEFLEDNKDLLQPNKLISIPSLFLSPNALQNKIFPKIDQFVDMTVTESMKKTINELLKSSQLDLYLRGPTGYGKSYLMALYTLVLRQKQHYRVLYVNNPEKCHENLGRYIANEFVYCFYRDFAAQEMPLPPEESIGETPLEKWYNFLMHWKTDAQQISLAFKELMRFSEDKGNPLVFVLDQMEVVTRCSGSMQYKSFAKNFYHVFQKSDCHRRVASASSNDETFKYHTRDEIKDIPKLFEENDIIQHLYGLLNHKISPEEVAAMNVENDGNPTLNVRESQENKPFEIDFPFMMDSGILKILPNWKKDEKYEKLLAILNVTGNSPYELSKVVESITSNKKDAFEDILENCFAESVGEYRSLHYHYRNAREHSQELKIRMFQAVIAVDTEKNCGSTCCEYDRNLIYEAKIDGKYRYYTMCPAVAKTFEKYYSQDFTFNLYILDNYNRFSIQDALRTIGYHKKDSTLAKFAIHEFRTRRVPHSLNYYFLDELNHRNQGTMNVLIQQFQYFETKKLEEDILKAIEYPFGARQKLFVADSPNYKLIDCVLLDHLHKDDLASQGRHRLTIYLIKITTCVNDHEKVDKIIASDEESLFGCKHDICKVIKKLKNEFLNKGDYELKFKFVWYTLDYLVPEIDFTKIQKDSWVLGANIFPKNE